MLDIQAGQVEGGSACPKFHFSMIRKGKGIRFIVLYQPECSPDLPSLAGIIHTETISIPQGIFQSSWQRIAHEL